MIAKNSLFNIGGVSPIATLTGTQPALLPQLDIDEGILDDDGNAADPLRKQHRIREISLRSMIETTAD